MNIENEVLQKENKIISSKHPLVQMGGEKAYEKRIYERNSANWVTDYVTKYFTGIV